MSVGHDNRKGFGRGKTARYALTAGLVVLVLGFQGYRRTAEVASDPGALDRALRQGIVDCAAGEVESALARGADPNRIAPESDGADLLYPPQGGAPLQAYVPCETPGMLQALREGGADLDPHLRRLTSLSMAPARPEVLAWLLQRGLDPNQRWANAEGWETLTHRAARRAQPALLAVLLAAGADPSARDSEGVTPLGRLEQVITRQSAALRSSGAEMRAGAPLYDPRTHFAEVIAMLQEAGGTE